MEPLRLFDVLLPPSPREKARFPEMSHILPIWALPLSPARAPAPTPFARAFRCSDSPKLAVDRLDFPFLCLSHAPVEDQIQVNVSIPLISACWKQLLHSHLPTYFFSLD